MSKTFAGICVALLSLILIVQVVTLFVSMRPKTVTVPLQSMKAKANMWSGETGNFNNSYYNGFGGGGEDTSVRVLDENGNCLSGGC